MKILIFGHSGSGKSTLAEPFANLLGGVWINADQIREYYDDWDFSDEGKFRQALRMNHIAHGVEMSGKIAVLDFICPLRRTRNIIDADYVVWMNTVQESKYKELETKFQAPKEGEYDYCVSEWFDDTHTQLVDVVKTYMERHNYKD